MSVTAPHFTSCCAGLYELPIVARLLGRSFHPGGTKLTRQLANATLISPHSSVLDLACGNGVSAQVIATDFGATVTGCDYSAVNLERAATASRAARVKKKTRFVRASAEQLPFVSESFDVSLCECSLCLFEDMDNALRQLHGVLKPGGRIGISDFFLTASVPESLDNPLGKILCVAAAKSQDGYREALSRAGFEYVRIRTVNWTLADMIGRVRSRLSILEKTNAIADSELPGGMAVLGPVLRELEHFIARGGAGYLIATGRKR